MQVKAEHVLFVPNPARWKEFTQAPDGVVGSHLIGLGTKLVLLAQRTVQKKSGALAASIHMTYYPVHDPFVRVGSDNKHALMMHNGTRPHWIGPEHQETLRFKIRGRVIYTKRVHHPGTRGSFFLSRHLRTVIK
jgi:hypothetical protein